MGMKVEEIESEILCIDGQIGSIGEALQQSGVPVHKLTRKQGFDWSLVAGIRKRLREGRFDVVHCHQYTPYVYGQLSSFFTGTKVVFTEHGRFHPDRYRYKAALVNYALAFATEAIIAISSATRDALARYEFMPRSKIQVIYNGITAVDVSKNASKDLMSRLGIPDDAFVIGTISRLEPIKNQKMTVQCFAALYRRYDNVWLLVVGDGTDRISLEAQAKSLDVEDRIVFTGFIGDPAIYLSLFNVFVLPSFTEGTSMTLLEAMSFGIPCVASRVGGTPEVVSDNRTGILFDVNKLDEFTIGVERLIRDPYLCSTMSHAALGVFEERFSSSVMKREYLRVYTTAGGYK